MITIIKRTMDSRENNLPHVNLRFARTVEDAWKLIELMAISDIEQEMGFIGHKFVRIFVETTALSEICVEIMDYSLENTGKLTLCYGIAP